MTTFSIIIPVKAINDYIREAVPFIQRQTFSDWELIIIPNEAAPSEWEDCRIRIKESGKIAPGLKRDLGAKIADGEYLVFLDDDSYPEQNYLDVAFDVFREEQVVALGGPAVTPKNNTYWQRVSGAVFISRFSGGVPERYVPIGPRKRIDDWPSVNMIVRKDIFLEFGGFKSEFWPGEDTQLWNKITSRESNRALYIPEMIVWHHRRAGLIQHLKQVGAYGLHRGFFVKRFPRTSLRLKYFLPSIFTIFSVSSPFLDSISAFTHFLVLFGWATYFGALIGASIEMKRSEKLAVIPMALIYTIFTHFWYGCEFIRGLLSTRLVSRLR